MALWVGVWQVSFKMLDHCLHLSYDFLAIPVVFGVLDVMKNFVGVTFTEYFCVYFSR